MVPHSPCNTLIRRSIDLRALYRDAAAQASEPGLRAVLGENAAALDALVADLQAQVLDAGGEPAVRGRLGGGMHRYWVEWLLPDGARRDQAWIRYLANCEVDLLHAFERGIGQASGDAARALRKQLPRLQGIHLDMHSLAGVRHG